MENRLDKVFDICILLVTVISAAELQYASTLFQSDTKTLNEVFRWTTIPLFFVVTIWLFLMIVPSSKLKNIGKAFCWQLFGNFYILLIISFYALSFSTDVRSIALIGEFLAFLVLALTTYTTWSYFKENLYKPNWLIKSLVFGIHLILWSISYLIVFLILGYSIILPTP